MNGYTYYNQNMVNQLLRQKDNIENMLSNMSQPSPVQNIINTGATVDFEAKELKDEDVHNVLVQRRTLFIDEKNQKIYIKEMNGDISKEYDIIVPKDEKDIKIEEQATEINILKTKMKELEGLINAKYAESIGPDDEFKQSDADDVADVESTTKGFFKSISNKK